MCFYTRDLMLFMRENMILFSGLKLGLVAPSRICARVYACELMCIYVCFCVCICVCAYVCVVVFMSAGARLCMCMCMCIPISVLFV